MPDRGGRPSKQAPPPEMPKFMKRVADPPRGGGGGGRGRGGYRGRSFFNLLDLSSYFCTDCFIETVANLNLE